MTISERLASPDEMVRVEALEALGAVPESVPLLVRALDDPSWRVRQAAVQTLLQSGAPAVAAVLRAMRDEHRNLGVLNGAIQILTQSGVDTLGTISAFLLDPDPELRTGAALTLGAQGDARAVPALQTALADADSNVRYHAIEALGKLRAGESVDALAAVVESRDFALAFVALDALAAIGDARVAYRLVPLLDDELLGAAAVDALGALGDEEVVAPLIGALTRPDLPAEAVARALVRLHGRYESAHHQGAVVPALVRQSCTAAGVQSLLDALDRAADPDLQALAVVLSWLEGPALERALTRLLGKPTARAAVTDALVQRGPRVVELLVEQLDAADLETRQAAVLALGRIGDARGVPALLGALNADEELVVPIAGALAMIGDRRAYPSLLGLLAHADASVRRAAVSALNALGHPDMAADMVRLLQDPAPFVREAAVRIIGYMGYPQGAHLLLACCSDRQENVRRAAVECLPLLDNAEVLPTLGQALHDDTAGVRAAAARALGQIEGTDAWPLLREALGHSDPWVRYFATRSVGRQRHADAPPILAGLAHSDPAMQVRVAAVEVLGRSGAEDAVAILTPLAQVADRDLARAALAALGTSGRADALPPLLVALDGPDAGRRLAAVRALGASGRVEAVAALARSAADPDDAVAAAAVHGLSQVAAPEAVEALIALVAVPARRDACTSALASAGSGHADWLARGLTNVNLDVRRAVVDALARTQDPRAAEVLKVAAGDTQAAVRLAAITALAHATPSIGS